MSLQSSLKEPWNYRGHTLSPIQVGQAASKRLGRRVDSTDMDFIKEYLADGPDAYRKKWRSYERKLTIGDLAKYYEVQVVMAKMLMQMKAIKTGETV